MNCSNHIRKGKEQFVNEWHTGAILDLGFLLRQVIPIKTPRQGFGANGQTRVEYEFLTVFQKVP